MSERPRGYARRVDITASPELVWRALTTSELLAQWCAPGAVIQPRAGGLFRASFDRTSELEAHIDVFDAPRRLRLIHLPSSGLPPADSAIVDDFILDPKAKETIVRLLGSGVPGASEWDGTHQRLRTSWERALARLKVFVERQASRETPT